MTEITARLLLFMITAAQSGRGGGGAERLKTHGRWGWGWGCSSKNRRYPSLKFPKYNLRIWFAQVNLLKPLNSECSVSESDL